MLLLNPAVSIRSYSSTASRTRQSLHAGLRPARLTLQFSFEEGAAVDLTKPNNKPQSSRELGHVDSVPPRAAYLNASLRHAEHRARDSAAGARGVPAP